MITTREINVNLSKGKLKLRQATTKNIDASLRVEPPKEPIKPRNISTTSLPDVADIAEKKRRDDIMAERKKVAAAKLAEEKKRAIKDEKKKPVTVKKKPWKEMTDAEKKLAMKERMVKVRAAKKKKKEGE